MSLEKEKKEIEQLKEKIRRADYQYYVLSEPEISDKEYDTLMKKLEKLEEKYPKLVTKDSPTQRVSGGLLKGFATVRHREKMLSLDNTYSIEELKDWQKKIKRMLKKEIAIDYMVELKIDGVSCALTYEKGILTLGATRGDGQTGEDVTANIKTIKAIPLRLRGDDLPDILEIRGEVFIEKKDFSLFNKQRMDEHKAPFANPRNAASGSLKLLDASIVDERNLKCILHSFGWVKGFEFKTQEGFLDTIKSWGLRIDTHSKHCRDLKEVIDYCMEWQGKRESLPYEVDGMVVKVNSIGLQKELGSTLKSPRWAVAYKFPAHQATTKIKRIDFGVGRTGIITPVALLEPVECGGVIISRTTLHNFDEIKRLGVRQGDTVLIERAGDVIPKVIKVINTKRTGKEKKVKLPSRCPVCGGEVAKEKEEEVYWYCVNPDCPAQLKRSLIHFASRSALDIEGMGESLVEELVERGMVESIADIYNLTKEKLLMLPLFKEKKASNVINAIEKSKEKSLGRFLYGLGIKHVGEKAASLLADKFKDIESFFKLKKEDLEAIPEIGPIMAESIINFFSSSKTAKLIKHLRLKGCAMKEKTKVKRKTKISDKVFIFTGELSSFTRSQAQEMVEEQGAKAVSSISKNIDFVVAGQNPGSKYDKAKRLGLNIIDEQRFKKLLGK